MAVRPDPSASCKTKRSPHPELIDVGTYLAALTPRVLLFAGPSWCSSRCASAPGKPSTHQYRVKIPLPNCAVSAVLSHCQGRRSTLKRSTREAVLTWTARLGKYSLLDVHVLLIAMLAFGLHPLTLCREGFPSLEADPQVSSAKAAHRTLAARGTAVLSLNFRSFSV